MLAKKTKKHDENGVCSHLAQRKGGLLSSQTLVIFGLVFALLMISIIYHGIVLDRFAELKQIVSLNRPYGTNKLETASSEFNTPNMVIRIPDSEVHTREKAIGSNTAASTITQPGVSLRGLNVRQRLLKYSRSRLSRELKDVLDPLSIQFMPQYETLKSKVRNKRTQIALSQLEKEYIRCKKATHSNSDCMTEFVRLYKVALEVSEKMGKMVELFKDSELVLQQSKSSKSDEQSSNESATIGGDPNMTTVTIKPQNSTTTTANVKPPKISWILDGNDDADLEEEHKITTTQRVATTVKISKSEGDTLLPTTDSVVNLTTKEDVFTDDTTDLPKSTTKSAKADKFGWILNVKGSVGSNDTSNVAINDTLETKSSNVNFTMPTTEMIDEAVKMVTFHAMHGTTFASENVSNTTANRSSPPVPIADDNKESLSVTTPRAKANKKTVESALVSDETARADSTLQNSKATNLNSAETALIKTDSPRAQNTTHLLDYPISVENMVGSFEHSDTLKPFNPHQNSNESKLYDPILWAQTFKNAAENSFQLDLVETFGEQNVKSAAQTGLKFNPANMKTLSGEDTELLNLCERMVQRLRNKATSNSTLADASSNDYIQTPAVHFTNRGPAGFPVTGESMKASAQIMFNPNFGMPSIPICFYLTPANFRMPTPMTTAWPNPYFNIPTFYGAGSGPFMGSGVGLGTGSVFFTPQNIGSSGNFFGTGSTSGSPTLTNPNIPNIPNTFQKNASPQKQQPQQFYCTYTQHNANDVFGGASSSSGNTNFKNTNSKLRTSNQTSPVDIVYASYAGVPVAPDPENKFKCELPGQVGCYGGNECIRESSWCDGTVDCSDSSDEAACTCLDRLANARVCDGYPDCPMGEDEIGCYGCDDFMHSCYANAEEYEQFNRSTVAMCYSSMEKCDGFMNCLNGRDELDCSILVSDIMNHMMHAVSKAKGFLYRNHRGVWYPVCNNPNEWAEEACKGEGGYTGTPNTTYREISLPGPFIEPAIVGDQHFPQSCQKRNDHDTLVDHAAYVECASSQCGNRKKNVDTSTRPKSKRFRRLRKRIVNSNEEAEADDKQTAGRIVGGKYSKPLEWPFVVALYRNGNFHCGGTIYSEHWIISAAHCVINYQKYFYEVRAGMLRRSSYSMTTQIQAVSHIVIHQEYKRRSMRNDLSLLRLVEPLRFNRWIKPICLPDLGRTTSGDDWIWGPESDTLCTAVGWGAVREKGPGSEQLREVVIPIRKGCTEKPDQESESICAGDADGGHDACQGDSGGPLFCQSVSNSEEWYLAGVVSHGNGCARPNEYGVYTRVALFLDWIELATKPELLPKLVPVQTCPGYTCVWGGKRCIPQKKRCNRIVDCLGSEDEVGCVYNFIPDLGSSLNTTTTESDYFPEEQSTTEGILQQAQNPVTTDSTESGEVWDGKNISLNQTLNTTSVTDGIPQTAQDDIQTSPKIATTSRTSMRGDEITTEMSSLAVSTIVPDDSTTESMVIFTSTEESHGPAQVESSTASRTTIKLTISTDELSSTFTTAASTIEGEDDVAKTTSIPQQLLTTTTESPRTNIPDLPEKFICQKIPQIIDVKHRCDRIVDCEDGTDEKLCSCRDYLKGTLNILVCDGKIDCEDETDESDCGFCQSDEFRCPLSKTCLPLEKRCDDVIDCLFKEDEKDCFALTNGMSLSSNANKQPVFKSAGIFTSNRNGIWRVVCAHETTFRIHSATTAGEICALLGFKGFKFYNTTSSFASDKLVVPIDPDIARMPQLRPHMTATVEDNMNFFSNENFYPIESKAKARSERIHAVQSVCLGLYVECNPISNQTEPLKILSASEKSATSNATVPKLQPFLKTHAQPNVFVKPESSPIQLIEQAMEDAKNTKNMSVLVNNEVHDAVEDLHWPWLVDIYANGRLWCVGVLLDKYWVMVHESCYFGVRLNSDYIVGLFGGGKSKNAPHKTINEQIKRIDCLHAVPDTDIILYHLESPVRFSQYVLPIYLPNTGTFDTKQTHECMALIHDEQFGRIKAVPITEHKTRDTCQFDTAPCYRFMENIESDNFPIYATINREKLKILEQENMTSKATKTLIQAEPCSRFGNQFSQDTLEPIDQGILVCHSKDNSWFPTGLFSYNNTNCQSFKEPFNIRTLERAFDNIQNIIDQRKCNFRYNKPTCHTFRCPLGKCLSSEKVCDGATDCHDGSDEDSEFCLAYKKVCGPGEMQCRSSKKCIPKTKFCDHIPDCEDFTDEPTICSCFTYLRATDPKKICDGIRNCWDKSDESPVLCNCTAQSFSCGLASEECIPHDFVCDKERDCPNGEDERYCYGIEQPLIRPKQDNDPVHLDPQKPPKYGQVIEQSYGVWHTKCFPRSSPPDISAVRQICKKLGYSPYRQPSYRLIDDAADEIVETNEPEPDKQARSFGDDSIVGKYRDATKVIVASKFSPLHLNDELTLYLKPSRPIAEVVRWNATDSSHCFRLEIRCG